MPSDLRDPRDRDRDRDRDRRRRDHRGRSRSRSRSRSRDRDDAARGGAAPGGIPSGVPAAGAVPMPLVLIAAPPGAPPPIIPVSFCVSAWFDVVLIALLLCYSVHMPVSFG